MKKVLMALLAALMAICVFAGCTIQIGGNGTKDPAPESSVNDESKPDESEPEQSMGIDVDYYLAWGEEDWDNANDDEKENCAVAYLLYVAEMMGEADNVTAELLRPEVDDEMIDVLDMMFQAIGLGGFDDLKDAATQGYEMLENE